jgi:hypothetical protein
MTITPRKPLVGALRLRQLAAHEPQSAGYQHDQQPAIRLQGLADGDRDAGRERQRLAHAVEHLRELRHDIAQQDEDRDDCHDDQDRRVHQGGGERAAHLLRAFHVIGEPFQHDLEGAAGLAGAQQAQVEAAKHGLLRFHRVRECRAFLHAVADVFERVPECVAVGQRRQDRERAIERQPGLQ